MERNKQVFMAAERIAKQISVKTVEKAAVDLDQNYDYFRYQKHTPEQVIGAATVHILSLFRERMAHALERKEIEKVYLTELQELCAKEEHKEIGNLLDEQIDKAYLEGYIAGVLDRDSAID